MPPDTQLVMLFEKLEYYLENAENQTTKQNTDLDENNAKKDEPEFKKLINKIKEAYKLILPDYKEAVELQKQKLKEIQLDEPS